MSFDPTTQGRQDIPKVLCKLTINGHTREVAVEQSAILLDVIREECNLTGTKRGCDMGTCGCCAVIIDGKAQLSCLTLALDVEGKDIRTVESLQERGFLHPVQEGFMQCGGSQCGFCTPGFIMTCTAFLERHPNLNAVTDTEIREAISGNLCRCTGFAGIVDAVEYAAEKLKGGNWPPADDAANESMEGLGAQGVPGS